MPIVTNIIKLNHTIDQSLYPAQVTISHCFLDNQPSLFTMENVLTTLSLIFESQSFLIKRVNITCLQALGCYLKLLPLYYPNTQSNELPDYHRQDICEYKIPFQNRY